MLSQGHMLKRQDVENDDMDLPDYGARAITIELAGHHRGKQVARWAWRNYNSAIRETIKGFSIYSIERNVNYGT